MLETPQKVITGFLPIKIIEKPSEKEKETAKEIEVKAEILDELNQMTRESKKEFWVFILGKNRVGEKYIPVALGDEDGISVDLKKVVAFLKPHIQEGYSIIADYHNHPEGIVKDYIQSGFPPEFATSPSTADLQRRTPEIIETELKQKPFPRLIAIFNPQKNEVAINAFTILRHSSSAMEKEIEFDKPGFIAQKATKLGIRVLGESYGQPIEMIKRGYFEPITLNTFRGTEKKRIPNPFEGVKQDPS